RMSAGSDGFARAFTPLYASPQQRSGSPPDPRDDVYALGVLWYQGLMGDLSREPPTGAGWKKRFVQHGMPAPIVDLLESCIDTDPSDRPADGSVLSERLTLLLRPRTTPAPHSSVLPRVLAERLTALPTGPHAAPVSVPAGDLESSAFTKLKL